jgi:hypothetical protein
LRFKKGGPAAASPTGLGHGEHEAFAVLMSTESYSLWLVSTFIKDMPSAKPAALGQ